MTPGLVIHYGDRTMTNLDNKRKHLLRPFGIVKRVVTAIILGLLIVIPQLDGSTMPMLDLTIVTGGSINGSVANSDVQSGFVVFEDQTELQVMSDVNWQVTANVVIDGSPAGTGNPTNLSIEVGNNDNPGEFNAGTGLVQTGTPGTINLTVDFRLNLSTLTDAPSGDFDYTITYTLEEL